MGLRFAGKTRRGASPGPFRQRPQVLFDKPAPRALDGHHTGDDLLGNLFIAHPFIGFQQNARAGHLAGSGLASPDDTYERVSLLCR
jgi:hypothetical protein